MAVWSRKKRRIVSATAVGIAVCLFVAMAFGPAEMAFIILSAAYLFYDWAFAPWDNVEVDLPDGAGELIFYRKSIHPFFAEYDRRIEIRYPSGQHIRSDLMVNTGARTTVYLHWQSASVDEGPFLWLQDIPGVTVINLAAPCLADDSKPTYAIPKWLRCRRAKLPILNDWRYFGRIAQTDQGLEFVAEADWPPDIESARRFASRRISLPVAGWDLQINFRPDPYDPHNRRYWITLTGPESSRVTAWFKDDYQVSWCCTPERATLFWYPATDSGGPYLRVGRFEGYGFGASTLIDLAGPRAYRAFRTSGMSLNYDIEGRVVTGMTPIEDLWTGYAGFYPPADYFVLNTHGAGERRLSPLPDDIRNVTPEVIGSIDLKTLTFSPDVFTPVYIE